MFPKARGCKHLCYLSLVSFQLKVALEVPEEKQEIPKPPPKQKEVIHRCIISLSPELANLLVLIDLPYREGFHSHCGKVLAHSLFIFVASLESDEALYVAIRLTESLHFDENMNKFTGLRQNSNVT